MIWPLELVFWPTGTDSSHLLFERDGSAGPSYRLAKLFWGGIEISVGREADLTCTFQQRWLWGYCLVEVPFYRQRTNKYSKMALPQVFFYLWKHGFVDKMVEKPGNFFIHKYCNYLFSLWSLNKIKCYHFTCQFIHFNVLKLFQVYLYLLFIHLDSREGN